MSEKGKSISFPDFIKMFPDEATAYEYFKMIFWPNGPVCPRCESTRHHIRSNSIQIFCPDCRKNYSIRTNTIFHGSHVPLHKWLYAMYLFTTARKGVSSIQLGKEIGIGQPAAWFLLQRLRSACGEGQWAKFMKGTVEADEAYSGGLEKNKHANKKRRAGRGAVGKIPVLGMRHRDGTALAQVVEKVDKRTLQGTIGVTVLDGSTVCTDEFSAYNGLDEKYTHKTVNHSKGEYVRGDVHTNGIESVWALLQRILTGTYHSVSKKHLNMYLNELTFRLNEGKSKHGTIEGGVP